MRAVWVGQRSQHGEGSDPGFTLKMDPVGLSTWAVGERHDFLLPGWASVAAGCPLLGWEAVLRSCVCIGGWDEELSLGHMKMMIQLNIQQEM